MPTTLEQTQTLSHELTCLLAEVAKREKFAPLYIDGQLENVMYTLALSKKLLLRAVPNLTEQPH